MGTGCGMDQAREYLLGCFREEDAAGGLLGLHQLLHQHPVQRREQPLRHSRLLFFLRSKQKRSKLPRSPWPHHHHPQPLGGFRVLWLNASAAEITDLPLGDRAPRRRNVLRPLRCRLERSRRPGLKESKRAHVYPVSGHTDGMAHHFSIKNFS